MIVSGSANPLLLGQSTGYNLTRSLRFRSSASAYLNRTFLSTPSIYTLSVWVKRGQLGTTQVIAGCRNAAVSSSQLYFNSSDQLYFANDVNSVTTTAVFRDPAAWYHVVLNFTLSGTAYLYVNNKQVASLVGVGATNYMFTSASGFVNAIGRSGDASSNYLDGYLAEVNFIDGQALTPSSFGSTNALTGVWQPAPYTGTYGTNGFYLPFTDNSALTTSSNVGLGKDFSGNGNYWTTNNISITAGTTYDSMTDVPTLTSATAANFCVMNPIDTSGTGSTGISITSGNLNLAGSSSDWGAARATFGMTSGKWYWECTRTGSASVMFGIGLNSTTLTYAYTSTSYSYFSTGDKYSNNVSTAYGASFASGDVIGVAFDADAGSITFYKNGTSQGVAYTGLTSGPYFPLNQTYTTSGTASINFGQRPFSYTPPTGYVALNTYNLPTPTILAGNKYMDATTYTGNGTSQSVVNAAPFQPDLVWIKSRSNADNHNLFDTLRVISGDAKRLYSNLTNAEESSTFGGATNLTTFNSNGFSVGAGSDTNRSGGTFVAWQWQAGKNTSSSNTSGSITSTVSVNASAGFSVVTYTGTGANATVGHGLGVAPSMVIVKNRTNTSDWQGYHVSLGQNYTIKLNLTAAQENLSNYWYNGVTSSVFGINGSYSGINASATPYVAYCFAPIAGYSAFGSYTGNGSTDGPMVYLGFRPKFVMIKKTATGGGDRGWIMIDSSRSPYNVIDAFLYANASDAEFTNQPLDFLSNGFKVRTNGLVINDSVSNIYMAFAENPTKYALAR